MSDGFYLLLILGRLLALFYTSFKFVTNSISAQKGNMTDNKEIDIGRDMPLNGEIFLTVSKFDMREVRKYDRGH
jgi:hypothetical protein